jgi:large subunit ribosomal protein L19
VKTVKQIQEISKAQMKPADQIPKFSIGDTVRVHCRIVEGEKERIQIYEGVVIGRKGGESPEAKFTVRRVAFGEGIERVFPLHSPRVEKVQVVREGSARRAKLYYLRQRSGKAARVKAKARSTSTKGTAAASSKARQAPAEKPAAAEQPTE